MNHEAPKAPIIATHGRTGGGIAWNVVKRGRVIAINTPGNRNETLALTVSDAADLAAALSRAVASASRGE